MKVIHCIGNLSGGGAETQLRLFYEHNGRGDFHNSIISLKNKGIDLYKPSKDIHIVKSLNIFKRWIEIYHAYKREKPDLIHIWLPAVFIHFLLPALLYNRRSIVLGIRSVYNIDSFKRLIHYLLYHFSTQYISNVHSEDMRGGFKKFTQRNFYYVPNAVNYSFIETKNSEYDQEEGPIRRLLFVGRLIEDKDILLLIKAISQLNKINQKFYLDICGEGPLKDEVTNLIREENLKELVTLHGFQKYLTSYYQRASCIILPSRREGMPNVVFEAACFRKCLILSDIPQHCRWFQDGHNAIFFRQGDLQSLCNALISFAKLSTKDKLYLIENNIKIIEGLSVQKYCLKLINTYEKISAGKEYR